jgi:hypothetical protein
MSSTNTTFWKQSSMQSNSSQTNSNQKFPGRVIMKQNNNNINFSINTNCDQKLRTNKSSTVGSKPNTPTKGSQQSHQNQHKRNNSSSFEVFTASCDDAWDSNIDECVTASQHIQHFHYSNPNDNSNIVSSVLIKDMVINNYYLSITYQIIHIFIQIYRSFQQNFISTKSFNCFSFEFFLKNFINLIKL